MNKDNEKISKQVADLYQSGENSSELSRQFGISVPTVLKCIRANDIMVRSISDAKRKYDVNRDYFSVIDSHEKAQILGFIAADGCVQLNRPVLEISIQQRDEDYLQYIKKCIGYEGPLRRYSIKNSKTKGRYLPYVRLAITSQKMKDDLIKLGIIPRKSLELRFPNADQVPNEFVSSFVLGYLEGDGGIYVCEGKKGMATNVKICVTREFGQKLAEIIKQTLDINSCITTPKTSEEHGVNMHIIGIGGSNYIKTLCAWLYSNAPFRMQRKYDRYLQLLSYYDANGDRIKEEGWSKRAGEKCNATRAKNGTWGGRVPKKIYHFMSPTGQVTQIKRLCQFAREMGLQKTRLYGVANGKKSCDSYHGWRLASSSEIAIAISSNSLIIKDYGQPVFAPLTPTQPSLTSS